MALFGAVLANRLSANLARDLPGGGRGIDLSALRQSPRNLGAIEDALRRLGGSRPGTGKLRALIVERRCSREVPDSALESLAVDLDVTTSAALDAAMPTARAPL